MAIRCQALWEHQTNFNRDRCVTQTVKLICIFLKPFFFLFSPAFIVCRSPTGDFTNWRSWLAVSDVLFVAKRVGRQVQSEWQRSSSPLVLSRRMSTQDISRFDFHRANYRQISVRLLCTIDATQPCIYLFFFPSRAHNTNAQPLPFPKSILLELYLKGGE